MFQGVYTALVTPFRQDGSIDEEALRRIVDAQIDAGVAGLVPVGTTGESPTVSHEENIAVVKIVVEQARGRVPVIAGTGSNSTSEAITMTERAARLGAAASLQVTPYYNKPSQEGLYRHFHAIADAVDIPMVVYNIPGRTGSNVATDTLARLAAHRNVVAVKEASGSLPQVMDVLDELPASFDVLAGDDNIAFAVACLGGRGVVSVASNVFPTRVVAMVNAALHGDLEHARRLHFELLPIFKALFFETNPGPIKYLMAKAGHCELVHRLPMVPVSDDTARRLDKLMAHYEALWAAAR